MLKLSVVVLVFCLAYAVYCADRNAIIEDGPDGEPVDVMVKRSESDDFMAKRAAQRPPSTRLRYGRSKTHIGRADGEAESDGFMAKRVAQRPPSTRLRYGRSKTHIERADGEAENDGFMAKRAAQRPPSTRLRYGRSKNQQQSSN